MANENDVSEGDAPAAPTPPPLPKRDTHFEGQTTAMTNPNMDESNAEPVYPKRHVTRQEKVELESGKDDETIAREVLEGHWGSGPERRTALALHGYDPNKVQADMVALLNKQKLDADREQHENL